jgi:hypothetical protein
MQQQKKQDTLFEVIMHESSDEYLITVKVIRSKGQVSLVEWDDAGRFRRTVVPREEVVEDEDKKTFVSELSLDMGIPYGVNWEARLKKSYVVTGARIAERLEQSGIWTKQDYDANPSVVQQAVLGAAREILTELFAINRKIP